VPGDVDRTGNVDGTEPPSWMLGVQVGRGSCLARIGSMGGDGPLRRRRSGKGRAVPGRCPSILASLRSTHFTGIGRAEVGGIGVIRLKRGA